MTIEEAKTASFNELAGYIQRNCFSCCCSKEGCYCDGDCVNQIAFDRLKEAFEKQIPKDPMKEDELGKTRCPNCGHQLHDDGQSVGDFYAMGVTTFCHFCGQAIKWDEEEWMKGYDWKKDNPFFDWSDDNDN